MHEIQGQTDCTVSTVCPAVCVLCSPQPAGWGVGAVKLAVAPLSTGSRAELKGSRAELTGSRAELYCTQWECFGSREFVRHTGSVCKKERNYILAVLRQNIPDPQHL
jgi:hypothetical protein